MDSLFIQWGSEIQISLDFEWLERGWVEMVQILNEIWNLKAHPFEIRTNIHHFVKNYLESGQKRIVFSYSHGLSPTIWKLDHLKSNIQKVWISNPHSRNA